MHLPATRDVMWLAAACGLLVGASVLWRRAGGPAPDAAAAPTGPIARTALDLDPAARSAAPTERADARRLAAAPERTADAAPGRTLPWPEAKEFLREACTTLDEGDREIFVDWALDWALDWADEWGDGDWGAQRPTFEEPEWNPLGKPLGPLDRERLERIIEEQEARIRELAEAALELYGDALAEDYEAGRFERLPASTPPPEGETWPHEGDLDSRRFDVVGYGWRVRVRFGSADHPVLRETLAEIVRLRRERAAAVRAYIASM